MIKHFKDPNFLEKLTFVISCNNDNISPEIIKNKKIKLIQIFYFSIILFAVLSSFLVIAIPLNYAKKNTHLISIVQVISFFILITDYLLLSFTHKFRKNNTKFWFLKFVFTWTSLILILAILSSGYVLNFYITNKNFSNIFNSFKILSFLKIYRLLMLLNLFSAFKMLFKSFKDQKIILLNIFIFIIIFILIISLLIWNAEETYIIENKISLADQSGYINNFWSSIYFTTITLTTIGYGDIIPHSSSAKMLVIIISIIGIAIFAIPSGVIAGSFLSNIQENVKNKQNNKSGNEKSSNSEDKK